MQLEDIEEEKEKFWGEPNTQKSENRRSSNDVAGNKQLQNPIHEQRRGSTLMAAAGIDFERRRKQQSGSISGGGHGESRIFKEGDQWMEEKDGKVTKLELIEVKEKMGRMRKAVPLLPVCVAIFLCILNVILPSTGTFIGAGTLLCGAKCRHETKSQGIKYGLLAGIIQLILTPVLVGWIFSMYYGVNIVQDALTRNISDGDGQLAKQVTGEDEVP